MASLRAMLARRAAEERGVTLIEVMVAMVISLLVAAAGMVVLQMAVSTQPQASERAAQIQEGRALIESISRELRQGAWIAGAGPAGLEVMTYVSSPACGGPPAARCRVTYSCEGDTCARTEHGSVETATTQLATGLLSPDVFSYCVDAACELATAEHPTYVEITLAYPRDDGGEAVTLVDGVALRNHYVPEGEG